MRSMNFGCLSVKVVPRKIKKAFGKIHIAAFKGSSTKPPRRTSHEQNGVGNNAQPDNVGPDKNTYQ